MRVAVYPGSFDPLHIGHLAIMRAVMESGSYDCIYLIVSPQNPLKDADKAKNAEQRFDAAVAAMQRHPELCVKVDDIELNMPAPHYTIRTLDALREREPGNSFTLVIGGDNLEIIGRWKDAGRILREYGVAVFPRQGSDIAAAREKTLAEMGSDCRIELIDAPLVNISSTKIREGLARGENMEEYII